MRHIFALATCVTLLTACQGGGDYAVPATSMMSKDSRGIAAIRPPADCANELESRFNPKKGGTVSIPPVPSSGNFSGYARYAPSSADYYSYTTFYSCSDNWQNIPVPQGYTPDWFGLWEACEGCTFTFENANLKMLLLSATWVPKVQYYLYLYTTMGGVLMTSYPIGTVKKKKQTITFSTPFENGLTWPLNDTISLEIVHAT